MTIIQKIIINLKKKLNNFAFPNIKTYQFQKFSPIILVPFLIIFSGLFFVAYNLIDNKNRANQKNLTEISKSSDFSSLKTFFISKLNSPYEEIDYIIKANDTVEKILKKYNVKNDDIKNISTKLKQKKLANIYSGRKLSLIVKKLENKSNTIVNLIYPINNTTSIEIRKI